MKLEFLSAAAGVRAQDDIMHLNLAGHKIGPNFLKRPVAVSDVQKVGSNNSRHIVVVTCRMGQTGSLCTSLSAPACPEASVANTTNAHLLPRLHTTVKSALRAA